MQLIDKRDRQTLQLITMANIGPGTDIQSDEWGAYIGLTGKYYKDISCCRNNFAIFELSNTLTMLLIIDADLWHLTVSTQMISKVYGRHASRSSSACTMLVEILFPVIWMNFCGAEKYQK